MDNLIGDLNTITFNPILDFGEILKVPLILILVGVLLYSFLLLLKVRILVDTVESEGNFKMKALVSINLFVTIFTTIFGILIILLG